MRRRITAGLAAALILVFIVTIPKWFPIAPSMDSASPFTAGAAESATLSSFGVIGSPAQASALRNFYWLLGNQSISYTALLPSQVKSISDVSFYGGLIVFTKSGGYNTEAIKQFAENKLVVADTWDFCTILYPSLSSAMQVIDANTVQYLRDWGNFHNLDTVDICNETGKTDSLASVVTSSLTNYSDLNVIAQYDANHAAFLRKNSTQTNGFFVMDLDATTDGTDWTGIWHVFPAVKMVQDFATGAYSEWMANGTSWWDLTWVYNRTDAIIANNTDIAEERIIGNSVLGHPIRAIFIGTGTHYAIIDGAIHGNEKTGTFACLRIAELLIQYYRSDLSWRSRLSQYTVIIVPVVNPDGFVSNTRDNANGVNLNRQFPPLGTTTEPEAWAMRNLMDNYPPTIYVNMHEGYFRYPLHMIYGAYETGAQRKATINAMKTANQTFAALNHWGYFTDRGHNVPINKVKTIGVGGGEPGMETDYASYAYGASCMLLETFVCSSTYGSRQSLWGLDYYPAVILSFISSFAQPDTTIKIANFNLFFTDNQNVKMIYPSDQTPKALKCTAAMVSDWTASAFVSTKLKSVAEGYDTDPDFIDQQTGNAIGPSETSIITFGGPVVNPLLKYAENSSPLPDLTPVKFRDELGTFYYVYQNGTKIPGASLPISLINSNQDLFLIEIYKDPAGRYEMLCYGFGWKGTYAAGKYFNSVIYPSLGSHSESWIIIKWNDTNNNGFVDTPDNGDAYTTIAKGN